MLTGDTELGQENVDAALTLVKKKSLFVSRIVPVTCHAVELEQHLLSPLVCRRDTAQSQGGPACLAGSSGKAGRV